MSQDAAAAGSAPRTRKAKNAGLGTFAGVFTPSILTILGIILFLRHGWVVGNAGLWAAVAIVLLAHAVSVLTSLSLAAIATNRRIRGGGDYFLISRSLGPEFGGALGLVLFLAQSVSVAFYCFGFGEVAATLVPEPPWNDPRLMAIAAGTVLFAIAWAGADLASRFQMAILAVLSTAIVSFLAGAVLRFDPAQVAENLSRPGDGPGIWVLFAIFFPAVTGFTQGVSMSGDLAEPRRSLPLGTFAAVGLSLVVYLGVTLLFVGGAPLAELGADYEAFRRFSLVDGLFTAGVVSATLSSALASFLGAPRILQAMARDHIFPFLGPFARGSGSTDNPRRAVGLCAGVAGVVFALGELNAVARLISMFFLISYGLLNLATFVEATGASPNFRPRFRFFHARLSLLGALLCIGAMIAISPTFGLAAIALMSVAYQWLRMRELPVTWGDGRPAFNLRRLKETLVELARLEPSEWSWTPNLLIFTVTPEHRDLLTRFGVALAGPSGFATSVAVHLGEGDFRRSLAVREALQEELRKEIEASGSGAFSLAVSAPDLRDAVSTVLQTWGIGPVHANTVLVGWRTPSEGEAPSEALRYGRQLQSILRLGSHLLVLSTDARRALRVERTADLDRRIDVWRWEDSSSRLALMLAYLMTRNDAWDDARIRVLAPCREDEDRKTRSHLAGVLDEARIVADIEVVPEASESVLAEHSRESHLVFFRMELEGMRAVGPLGGPLDELLPRLPATCLVGAAGAVKLSEDEEEEAPAPTAEEGEAEEDESA